MSDYQDRITINPSQCGGRPCIRGSRIRGKDILNYASRAVDHRMISSAAE